MKPADTLTGVSRRGFIKATSLSAGSLMFGLYLPARASAMASDAPVQINTFIRIDPDNTITLLINHSEFGNGAYTSLPMMVAEELDAAWDSIKLEPAPTSP
jgi:isoquinoline 1-oxidoreductase beta subunit